MPFEAFNALDPTRRSMVGVGEWALCVGAGICQGIMPDWPTVTARMLGHARSGAVDAAELEILSKSLGWSFDSLLQYALNAYLISGRTIEDFNNDLANELYSQLLDAASVHGLDSALSKLLSNPFSRNSTQILDLESFLSRTFGTSSLMQIARVLLRSIAASRNPSAVLTFNADVLLHVALTLLQIRQSFEDSGDLNPDFCYRALHRSTDRPNGKIPIYHVHGSITPESGRREAREKLIFPESSYSQLASSIYSRPQTTFLSNAQSCRMVFVGLSMSDPNIRRWLSWCEGYRRAEISQTGSSPLFLSQHMWITTRSKDARVQKAKEYGLLHLGIRTAFIEVWDELENALANLIDV